MIEHKLLNKLLQFENSNYPFISIYLNTEPNENGQFDYDVFVKKQLSENSKKYEEQSKAKESFDRDAEKIHKYLQKINPSSNGVAIFACSGEDEFFETVEFDTPIEEDKFFVFDSPHITPFVRFLEQNPIYAIAIADTQDANIYVVRLGEIKSQEEIESQETSKSEAGGWSQMRFQRHVDHIRLHHAKDIVEELDRLVREKNIDKVVLSGNEDVIMPILNEQLTEYLKQRITGKMTLPIDTPEHKLIEESEKVLNRKDTLEDKEKIDYLKDQNYDEGLGAVGVEKVLAALSNGQVQELYLNANLEGIKYNEEKIQEILQSYSPNAEIPNTEKSRLVIDKILKLALDSTEKIRFVEDENLLKDVGGIGAILRYTMNGEKVASA